ncbi:hypothetical protein VTK73DRAFT_3391 [Phialemonium thermophilum]|uniref:Mitochondrial distribution and morphology protein 34 n=1 Tax=Phialemonium thermophilum TaxID=223376 RepID=A0ABR3X062_9PEZI
MAFNFNWSPLTADAEFYRRTRDLLTAALNKSPKPPIIVDDILVTEFNLGSVPPELEILEIGDIAEDRFRGIFKMTYSGDAFLTLKTRVQANPLNTYLYSKPSFTSPQPLAAASGLTIPLQITLSEIKLSAFIILVFSKQKGLTLVFRNDPLESLKVSSTFDSIQFVRDYLQKTIEGKLRDLMMDELPAIIHRLSLQLWCPDQLSKEVDPLKEVPESTLNPLATSPPDAVDVYGHLLDPSKIASLSVDGGTENQSLFSQKNILRLAALANSHRTLSLFTPGIQDAVFRAWTGPMMERLEISSPVSTPSLSKSNSFCGNTTTYSFAEGSSLDQDRLPSRPSLVSFHSSTTGLALGSGRHSKSGRKKKRRVVNLRRNTSASEPASEAGDSTLDTASIQVPASEPALVMPSSIPEEVEPQEENTLGTQMPGKVRFRPSLEKSRATTEALQSLNRPRPACAPVTLTAQQEVSSPEENSKPKAAEAEQPEYVDIKAPLFGEHSRRRGGPGSDTSSVILEQAWIMKMAGEIARRVYDEKHRNPGFWEDQDDAPPPAYEAS